MSFDRLARHYDWMEKVLAGNNLHQCRISHLNEVRGARSILLAGEGHGRFLPEVCHHVTGANIYCLDASRAMNQVAEKRLRERGAQGNTVQFQTLDWRDFILREDLDLIVTHFFLDCFDAPELSDLTAKFTQMLKPDGKWIIADFQVPPRGWRRYRAQAVLKLAYRFFNVAVQLPARQLISPQKFLLQHGLRREKRHEFNFGLLYAEVWAKPPAVPPGP